MIELLIILCINQKIIHISLYEFILNLNPMKIIILILAIFNFIIFYIFLVLHIQKQITNLSFQDICKVSLQHDPNLNISYLPLTCQLAIYALLYLIILIYLDLHS
jgi:hypothetical protein